MIYGLKSTKGPCFTSTRTTIAKRAIFGCAPIAVLLVLSARAATTTAFPATLELAPGSRVAFEGDSLIYGQDETQTGRRPPINGAAQGRSASPTPEHFDELLGYRLQVENRGFPGDRTIDGLRRWRAAKKAALVVIMYWTNDAMNFAGHPDGAIGLERYARALQELVLRRQKEGAAVVLMTPPADWHTRVGGPRFAVPCCGRTGRRRSWDRGGRHP